MSYKRKMYRRKGRMSSRRRRGRYSRRRASRRFARKVNRVMMKKVETKRISSGLQNQDINHNTNYCPAQFYEPWKHLSLGVSRAQRIGNEVIPVGIRVKLCFINKEDRPNIRYRVRIGFAPRMFNGTAMTAAVCASNCIVAPDFTNFGGGGSALGNITMWDNNYEGGWKVVKDYTLNVNKASNLWDADKETHYYKQFWIKAKKGSKIKYTDGGTIENRHFYVCISAYDSISTVTLDTLATWSGSITLYYKDP